MPPGGPGAPGAPPMPPFPWGPGPWMGLLRRRLRARRGEVRHAILALLAEEPRNGYQIMQELEQRTRGMWRPSPGAMYPALQQLEDEGLIRVDTAGGGRVFHLTDRGRAEVDTHAGDARPWDPAATGTVDGRAELMEAIQQLVAAAGQVGQAGTPAQIASAQQVVRDARRALYRILAEDDAAEGDDEDDADDADDDE